MPVSITDSFITEKARDYAALSDLAYAEWKKEGNEWILIKKTWNSAYYSDLWDKMKQKGYYVLDHKTNVSDTGYSGTLFKSGDGSIILANRGSELIPPFDPKDYIADGQLATHETPSEQFRSMVEYIDELKADRKIAGQFDVAGHSLGGCLAQMAAALSQGVNNVYTYNAPGAQNLKQNYFLLRDSEKQGYVVVRHYFDPSGLLGWEDKEWRKTSWEGYKLFLDQRMSVDGSKVYNVSGIMGSTLFADWDQDIGMEVFINGKLHSIQSVENNLLSSPFYVDPRNPVTVIGSNRNETFDGNYDSKHFSGSAPGSVTLVGGYGNDELWGSDQGDYLYGDLPGEMVKDAAARKIRRRHQD